MSELIVVAKVVAKKDSVEEVKRELLKLIKPTRDEEGCVSYDLHQDKDNPAIFVFYETWKNDECLESHMSTTHFKDFVAAIGSMTEEIAINKLARL